jgi:hypothetical protein
VLAPALLDLFGAMQTKLVDIKDGL